MRKLFLKHLILTACFFCIVVRVAPTKVSKTFFKTRTISNSSIIPLSLGNFHIYHNNYRKTYIRPKHWSRLSLQGACFCQESFGGDDLAKYFLFGEKTTLSVKEDRRVGAGDIWSRWLRLESPNGAYNFDSEFTIYPKRKVCGGVFDYRRDLSQHIDGLWFSVLLPVVKVEHDLRLQEFDKAHLGVTPPTQTERSNIVDALNNPSWKYGKFSNKKLTKSGIDDCLIKIGFNAWSNRTSHVDFFGTFLAPTGNQARSEYVFEPLVGNGGHVGIGGGTDFSCAIFSGRKRYIHLLGNIRGEYLFRGVEWRSFDLKNNGPWSRYLLVVKEGEAARPLPGINFFTRDMWITPQWNLNALFALHGEFSNFNVEIGYNFWWKDNEKVRLYHKWDEDVEQIGIADPSSGVAFTASVAKIGDTADTLATIRDTSFVKIKQDDLDLNSSIHSSALAHSVYAALSLNSNIFSYPWMVGFGCFCEFADSNSAIRQYGGWLKMGVGF